MKEKALQILLVEDNAGDARLLREMFRKERADSFKLTHLLNMSEALVHLAKGGVDVVLLDLGLPDGHGLETVRRARAAAPGIPLIVLTGLDDEVLAAQAMREGAQDYLIKGQIENRALPRALRHAIERHRMQKETDLIRTHQMQFKDDFLSNVSHELRSPLTAIYQFATILLDRLAGDVNEEQGRYLEIVLRNVKQLQSMIDDLLEVTRVQAGKVTVELQSTSTADAITYSVATLTETALVKQVTFAVEVAKHTPAAYADPIRLRQILLILLDNAIKFTPDGGAVTVRAQVLEKDPNFLLVEVSDSGCGINPTVIDRIFERLYQVAVPALGARKGLGLGLYICKELVLRQGGLIWVSSSPGAGAIFSFTLPVFSLDTLIAPLLRNEAWPTDSVAVMSVEIGSQDGWLSKENREDWSRESRILIQNCLLPDLDVLLPKMDSGGAGEVIFVVVFANDRGAEVLAKRIRDQFDHREQLKQDGLTFSVSYKRPVPPAANIATPSHDTVGNMATRIGALIKSELQTRTNPS
jgi:signal transduction histidine kinase